MEIAPYEGLEVVNDVPLVVIDSRQHRYLQPERRFSPRDGGPCVHAAHSPEKRIYGLSRAIFWLAMATTVLAAIVLGLGIGLGVALSNAHNANTCKTELQNAVRRARLETVPANNTSSTSYPGYKPGTDCLITPAIVIRADISHSNTAGRGLNKHQHPDTNVDHNRRRAAVQYLPGRQQHHRDGVPRHLTVPRSV